MKIKMIILLSIVAAVAILAFFLLRKTPSQEQAKIFAPEASKQTRWGECSVEPKDSPIRVTCVRDLNKEMEIQGQNPAVRVGTVITRDNGQLKLFLFSAVAKKFLQLELGSKREDVLPYSQNLQRNIIPIWNVVILKTAIGKKTLLT